MQERDNIELLNTVVRTTEMGKTTLDELIPMAERPEFKAELLREQRGYRDFNQQAHTALAACGSQAECQTTLEKWMARAGIVTQTFADRSTEKLAEMVVKGNRMGVAECVEGLREHPAASTGAKELARGLRLFEEENIASLRQFL